VPGPWAGVPLRRAKRREGCCGDAEAWQGGAPVGAERQGLQAGAGWKPADTRTKDGKDTRDTKDNVLDDLGVLDSGMVQLINPRRCRGSQ
jgi:hypothetical protein